MTPVSPRLRASELGLVFVGGALGTALRLAVTVIAGSDAGLAIVNVCGAFLLGLVTAVFSRFPSARNRRLHLLIGTGALGAFTTYSTLAVATTSPAGLVFAVLMVLGGVVAAAAGYAAGGGFRRVAGRPRS